MSLPDEKQLQVALAEAERMRDLDEDPRHVARCLLYLARRVEALEHLQDTVEHYEHSGHGHLEHARMVRALSDARQQERGEAHNGSSDFGLE